MASLRNPLGRVIATENDAPLGKMVGKAALAGPGIGGLKSRPVRGAMQEISNNLRADKGTKTWEFFIIMVSIGVGDLHLNLFVAYQTQRDQCFPFGGVLEALALARKPHITDASNQFLVKK